MYLSCGADGSLRVEFLDLLGSEQSFRPALQELKVEVGFLTPLLWPLLHGDRTLQLQLPKEGNAQLYITGEGVKRLAFLSLVDGEGNANPPESFACFPGGEYLYLFPLSNERNSKVGYRLGYQGEALKSTIVSAQECKQLLAQTRHFADLKELSQLAGALLIHQLNFTSNDTHFCLKIPKPAVIEHFAYATRLIYSGAKCKVNLKSKTLRRKNTFSTCLSSKRSDIPSQFDFAIISPSSAKVMVEGEEVLGTVRLRHDFVLESSFTTEGGHRLDEYKVGDISSLPDTFSGGLFLLSYQGSGQSISLLLEVRSKRASAVLKKPNGDRFRLLGSKEFFGPFYGWRMSEENGTQGCHVNIYQNLSFGAVYIEMDGQKFISSVCLAKKT